MTKEEKIVGQCKSSVSKEYLKALYTFNYIMTRCEDEDSYIIKFPLGIQEGTTFGEDMEKAYKVIKEALQRLEAIENANHSEALECLEEIGKTLMFTDYETLESKTLSEVMPNYYKTIKQALIKSQEQEKVLEIIKEKNVNIGLVNVLGSVEQYNQTYVYDNMRNVKWCLTQEEFDLLKRYFE